MAHGIGGPLPVVLAFPGGGQRIEGLEANSRLHAAPQAAHFLVAYLEGYERTFNVGGYCCGAAARNNVDDLAFVQAVLADLRTVAPIDRRRVYATGFSNGGQFTYYLACHMAGEIAAIASVSGAMQPPFEACRPSRPVPIMHWAGLADRFDPFQGGQSAIRTAPVQPPVEAGIDLWRRLDGTRATAQVDVVGADAQCSESWSQPGAAVIVLCLVPGLGHQWPGLNQEPGSPRVLAALGPFGPRMDVNDVLLDFFAHFTLP